MEGISHPVFRAAQRRQSPAFVLKPPVRVGRKLVSDRSRLTIKIFVRHSRLSKGGGNMLDRAKIADDLLFGAEAIGKELQDLGIIDEDDENVVDRVYSIAKTTELPLNKFGIR